MAMGGTSFGRTASTMNTESGRSTVWVIPRKNWAEVATLAAADVGVALSRQASVVNCFTFRSSSWGIDYCMILGGSTNYAYPAKSYASAPDRNTSQCEFQQKSAAGTTASELKPVLSKEINTLTLKL
ncbi:hypothetical protein DL96DRAFT_1564021 [Flagelloscypha sp. PMI_526]|nr:hypothetical protein DL96DRAFT_1564021 [Flagelloscypha sp. PMI_526]